jgi:glycosyltransferase involved in cell wall biosynthesis
LSREQLSLDYVHKATFWAQKTKGSVYVRCELPARHLPGRVLPFLYKDLFFKGDMPVFPRQAGAAIWQYPGSTANALLMAGMQKAGYRVLVESDDNYVVGVPRVSGFKSEWDFEINKERSNFSYEAHRRICEFADGVIVSTPKLAESYEPINEHIYVCPNYVDPDDWPEPNKLDDGKIRFGFAGSLSHYMDINLAKLACEWLATKPDVELVFVGLHPRFPLKGNVRLVDWTDDHRQFRQNLGLLDVALAPLLDHGIWASGKSDVKALEYAMAGALPIVQQHESFSPWLAEGVDEPERATCLVAKDSEEFLENVQWCYEHRDDVKVMAENAKQYVLRERTIQNNVWRWQEAIDGEKESAPGLQSGAEQDCLSAGSVEG